MLGFELLVTRQIFLDGIVAGMIYGLVALGIVLIYRSTRVINFAVANLGLVGSGLFALLNRQYRVPFWIAAAIGLVAGLVYGAVIEMIVVRRLFHAPRVIVLVATIGISQLSMLLLILLPNIDVPGAKYPLPLGSDYRWLGFNVQGPALVTLLVAPLGAAGLGALLSRTALGKAVKASADNSDLARLAGISPKVVSTAVWAIAAGLATLALALLAGNLGSANNLQAVGPSTMIKALAAAVIGGLFSFRRAFLAGIALGVVEVLVRVNMVKQPGMFDFLMLLLVLAAVYRQSRSGFVEARTYSYAAKVRPVPERVRGIWWVRSLDKAGFLVLGALAVALPLVVTQASRHLSYTIILTTLICALSLTVLTGWSGQLSLGQMAFAGFGAYLTAHLYHGLNFDLSWGSFRLVKAGISPLPFVVSILVASVITGGIAALIGMASLRVRGLFLAVSTFAFAFAASQYLFRRPILTGGAKKSVVFKRDFLWSDVKDQRGWYYVVLVAAVLLALILARLRRTGVARTAIAVRDNPDTAAAYTISPTKVKVRSFALAGAIAAFGGGLLAANLQTIDNERFYTVEGSLALVAVAVIGGIGSVGGAILGAVWVAGIPALFPGNDIAPLLGSSIGILLLLMYFPGGIVQVGYALRDAIVRMVEKRMGPPPAKQARAVPPVLVHTDRPALPAGTPALAVEDVTVRFGGNTAVDGVSLQVDDGEIVGLIGTNGAGKSTLMNAISGFVPSTGRISLFGHDVSAVAPSKRAGFGLGRTFQAAGLFPELTVTETVLVALEARRRTGALPLVLLSPLEFSRERARRAQAAEIIDFLGLGRFADVHISDLSTGTRRIVELAGLLALDARLLCLDEPTAGLAQKETEAFGPLILNLRKELSASMVVIEHDMPLIMSISDRVYCLEAGQVIASGSPADVRANPAVIASYLGTDSRAIARSGSVS